MTEYTSLQTVDGRELDPAATFTHAEWESRHAPRVDTFDRESLNLPWLARKLTRISEGDFKSVPFESPTNYTEWLKLNAIETDLVTAIRDLQLSLRVEALFLELKERVVKQIREENRDE